MKEVDKSIFLIERACCDPLENHPHDAFYYEVIGYTESEDDARALAENSPLVTKKDFGWAAKINSRVIRYKKVDKLLELDIGIGEL